MPTSTAPDVVVTAARILKVLGNAQRLLIVCRLAQGTCTVGHLQDVTNLSQSALSQHLALLRRHDLVTFERDGTRIYYELAHPVLPDIMRILKEHFGCVEEIERNLQKA